MKAEKLLSLLLCLCLVLSLAVPALAEEPVLPLGETVAIRSEKAFLEFAEKCRLDSYSENLTVELKADLDLTGMEFQGIPLFKGTFRGNGHRIGGFCVTAPGTDMGFFRRLTITAVVEDLNLEGTVAPGGSRTAVGGMAGRNEGRIERCSFSGTVSGADSVGGMAGCNDLSGIIAECTVRGEVSGSHFVGGMAGENRGVLRDCENLAAVNTTALENTVKLEDITLDTLLDTEAANTVTDIGGIAGRSSGVIRDCDNRGQVGYQHMGYNIGGIAGTQSGYILRCRNFADIRGRKEVGGIAGQMEPVTMVEFTVDALQILKEQLGTMSGLVSRASGNARSNAGDITEQIVLLQDQTELAREAVESLLPTEEKPLPDLDTVLAAQNALSSVITAMPGTMNQIAEETKSTVVSLGRDLQAISAQINAMGKTIDEAGENLGGTISDVSDLDTEDSLTGKVEQCRNLGNVLGDLNVGGIVGAMAMENDLDLLENWEILGENSLNFESNLRCVLLSSENRGLVTGGKANLGGIAGWQSLGLIRGCLNTGDLEGSGAQYVGGVAGLSAGYLRGSSAKCTVSGASQVGGIAGSAAVVTDCRSLTRVLGAEKLGAVLGVQETPLGEVETPVRGNFYLPAGEDIGAIDGVSYNGLAQSLALEDFMTLEGLDPALKTVSVEFLFPDGTSRKILLNPGATLDSTRVPEIPALEGHTAHWEGLTPESLTGIPFDISFRGVYSAYDKVIRSEAVREETGLPLLLAEGSFTPEVTLHAEPFREMPPLGEEEVFLEAWTLTLGEGTRSLRFHLPPVEEQDRLKLLVRSGEGPWEERPLRVEKSYGVFDAGEQRLTIALALRAPDYTVYYIAAAAAGAALLILLVTLILKKTRKKPAKQDVDNG